MSIRRGRSRQGIVGSRRLSDWGVGPSEDGTSISATGKLLWSAATTPSQPLTLIRTRGYVSYMLTGATANADGFVGASGIYLMTEDAFAVGVTAALNPLTDSNSDMWLWHHFWSIHDVLVATGEGGDFSDYYRFEIDSKAMRKGFDPERVMVGVTGVTEQGTATMEVNARTRQLFKT